MKRVLWGLVTVALASGWCEAAVASLRGEDTQSVNSWQLAQTYLEQLDDGAGSPLGAGPSRVRLTREANGVSNVRSVDIATLRLMLSGCENLGFEGSTGFPGFPNKTEATGSWECSGKVDRAIVVTVVTTPRGDGIESVTGLLGDAARPIMPPVMQVAPSKTETN